MKNKSLPDPKMNKGLKGGEIENFVFCYMDTICLSDFIVLIDFEGIFSLF